MSSFDGVEALNLRLLLKGVVTSAKEVDEPLNLRLLLKGVVGSWTVTESVLIPLNLLERRRGVAGCSSVFTSSSIGEVFLTLLLLGLVSIEGVSLL